MGIGDSLNMEYAKRIFDRHGINYKHKFLQTQYNKIKLKTPEEEMSSFLVRVILCKIIHSIGDAFISWCDFVGKERVDILWIRKDGRLILIKITTFDRWLELPRSIKDKRIVIKYKRYGEKNDKWITALVKETELLKSFPLCNDLNIIFNDINKLLTNT